MVIDKFSRDFLCNGFMQNGCKEAFGKLQEMCGGARGLDADQSGKGRGDCKNRIGNSSDAGSSGTNIWCGACGGP